MLLLCYYYLEYLASVIVLSPGTWSGGGFGPSDQNPREVWSGGLDSPTWCHGNYGPGTGKLVRAVLVD